VDADRALTVLGAYLRGEEFPVDEADVRFGMVVAALDCIAGAVRDQHAGEPRSVPSSSRKPLHAYGLRDEVEVLLEPHDARAAQVSEVGEGYVMVKLYPSDNSIHPSGPSVRIEDPADIRDRYKKA
jgi:hypothetical protein